MRRGWTLTPRLPDHHRIPQAPPSLATDGVQRKRRRNQRQKRVGASEGLRQFLTPRAPRRTEVTIKRRERRGHPWLFIPRTRDSSITKRGRAVCIENALRREQRQQHSAFSICSLGFSSVNAAISMTAEGQSAQDPPRPAFLRPRLTIAPFIHT